MRQAFCNLQVTMENQKTHGSIIKQAISAANNDAGIRSQRDWNAHLKLRTYSHLKEIGVMS